MKHAVILIKDLKTGLKEIERFIKQPKLLWSGREPTNFKQRPREIVANWFISAVVSYTLSGANITFSTDPIGGDGIIVDKAKQSDVMHTEHAFVGCRTLPDSLDALIEKAVADKMENGKTYAGGKTLIIFLEGGGTWKPNMAARRIEGKHQFNGIWTVGRIGIADDDHEYGVSCLSLKKGNAPTWKIKINPTFDDWTVVQTQ